MRTASNIKDDTLTRRRSRRWLRQIENLPRFEAPVHELSTSLAHVGIKKTFEVSEVYAPLLQLKILITRGPVTSATLIVRKFDYKHRMSVAGMLYPDWRFVHEFDVGLRDSHLLLHFSERCFSWRFSFASLSAEILPDQARSA